MTAPATDMRKPAEPVRRTAEIEEFTNATIIHPISFWLTQHLAQTRVTPNAVSLTGMLCGILAGLCYHHYRTTGAATAGFLLMVAWHVMDGADGQLARLTRSQSDIGKVLDGICDYVTFTAVYIGLASALYPRYGSAILVVAAVAGVCHAIQAAAYEAQRQDYEVWGCGKPQAHGRAHASTATASPLRSVLRRLDGLYIALQSMTRGAGQSSREQLTATFGTSPEQDDAIRHRYRAAFAPAVRRWSILSANYRTVAIFGFALLKAPSGYFVFEIAGLSIVLAVLLSGQRRRYAKFLTEEGKPSSFEKKDQKTFVH